MSISLNLSNITAAIKNISVTGVTIKDYSGIAASWQSLPNVLYPNPEGFITNFTLDYQTVLRGGTAPVDVSYTLNYRYLGPEIGDLSQMPKEYSEMIVDLVLILNAMITTDAPYAGTVEMEVSTVLVGARSDPVGNVYHGADIALNITEMQNA